MSDDFDWRLIDRHLAGEASAEDEVALQRWLAADPRRERLLRGVSDAVRSPDTADWDVSRAWSRVSARLHEPRSSMHLDRRAMRRPRERMWLIAGAGVGVVGVLLAIVVWAPEASRHAAEAPAVSEIAAAPAQQTRATLRDGTRIVLNAGSRLRYPATFGESSRDVELEGEGYFEVVHDAARPFRVHARGSVTEDLGTRFVVRAYPELRHVEVAVAEGRVALHHDGVVRVSSTLTAGQRGRIETDGSVSVVDDADVERWLEWTRGGLVLDGITLGQAATEIGRRFDVRIDVADSALAVKRVSARFRDESLPRVLDGVSAALGMRWTRDGDRVRFEEVR
jgi:transmembrane sensor